MMVIYIYLFISEFCWKYHGKIPQRTETKMTG